MKSQEIEEKEASVKRQSTAERRDSFSEEKTKEMFVLLSSSFSSSGRGDGREENFFSSWSFPLLRSFLRLQEIDSSILFQAFAKKRFQEIFSRLVEEEG